MIFKGNDIKIILKKKFPQVVDFLKMFAIVYRTDARN